MNQFNTLIFFFIFIYSNAQVHEKDTLFGNVKSIREKIDFVDKEHQNRKLLSIEGDYGHNGFQSPEYTINRFHDWWYNTYWVHYINYYKEFISTRQNLIC